MVTGKHTAKIIAAIMALAVCLCLSATVFANQLTVLAGEKGISMEYETALFDTSQTITINILMDEEDWADMLANAAAEEYYQCDVVINGETFYGVGIRPKGNTSLTTIASDPDTDRYSFKLEFDHYVDGQTCYGLDKLVLNNNYADATNMKEALIYDMYQYLGADASLYNYASISVNGEYWGVYLALEAVEDSFLMRSYGAQDGELYKPDSMNIGGFDMGDFDMGNFSPSDVSGGSFDFSQFSGGMPEGFEAPESGGGGQLPDGSSFDFGGMNFGGLSLGGGGSDLNYTDDDLDSYSTIWEGEVTSTKDSDHRRVVTALKNISEGTDLETYMDVDNLLRYMAVHIFSVNEDSLSGMMAHNYYLYESGGQLNLIPWDYNLAFGGMGGDGDATSVVNEAIDNAFAGTDFFDTLMEDETYHQQYYAYMAQLAEEYINGGGFDEFYQRVRSQIDELVEIDPTAFYTYQEYLEAVETLYEVVKLRGESISGQLDGTIPSTSGDQSGSDALIDASHIDLSVLGSMDTGGSMGGRGGMDFSASGSEDAGTAELPTEETGPDPAESAAGETAGSALSTGQEGGAGMPQFSGTPPEGLDISQSDGTLPEDFDPSQFDGQLPDGFDSSQFGGELPEGFDPSQFGTQGQGGTGNSAAAPESGGFSDTGTGSLTSPLMTNLLQYAVSLAVIAAALLFAVVYRRRPRRR